MVVSCEAKKKHYACASFGLHDHYSIIIIIIITSTSDLQPSTAIVNQLLGIVMDLSVKT